MNIQSALGAVSDALKMVNIGRAHDQQYLQNISNS